MATSLNSKEHLFFVTDTNEIDVCGNKFYYFEGSEFAKPTDFKRLNYEKHNLETCTECKKHHTVLRERIAERFKEFPNCCPQHAKLNKEQWFKRSDFENIPELYADKLYFTWHHILNYIDDENWREEIFDFIEYIFNTFGSFPIDYGEPLYFKSFRCDLLSRVKRLADKSKAKEIAAYINEFGKPAAKLKTDFNVLLQTYNKWYKIFPFEFSFFEQLKGQFAKTIPIVEKTHYNKYLKKEKATLLTNQKLLEVLLKITDRILIEINALKLYESGQLKDPDKLQFELVVQQRKVKLKEGYSSSAKDPETKYRRMLKAWLKDEIKFIKDIRSHIKKITQSQSELHEAVLHACYKMQENKLFHTADENARTKQILDLISANFFTKDQSQYGKSGTGKKPGSVDGVITDANNTEHFLEALNIGSINRTVIQSHVEKLETKYDTKGLPVKYLLIYCNVADGQFLSLFDSYLKYIKTELSYQYPLRSVEETELKYTNIRQLKSVHDREGKTVILYHLLIKMAEDTIKK